MHGSRKRILDAAFDLFAKHGYAAVSTGDIARRARVNQSTLFRQFKSKEAIAKTVMDENVDRASERAIATALSKSTDIDTCVKLFASYYAHAYTPKFVKFQMCIAIELPGALKFHSPVMQNAFVKSIRDQQSKNKFRRVDPVTAERMLHCAIYGLSLVKAFNSDKLRTPTVCEALSFRDIWLKGMMQ